jgi:hypothetical protein
MTLKPLVLIAALLAATGASAAAKPPAHKAAPAARSAAAPPALPTVEATGAFDARDPSSLMALLATLGAKAQTTSRDKEGVLLKVTSPAGDFRAQFDGCNQQGRACQALQFDAAADAKTATIAEVNGFNQSSLACRIIQDKAGKPHVLYSALVFASTTRADMLTHVNAWRGCLSDFAGFLKDPPGYLAAAP